MPRKGWIGFGAAAALAGVLFGCGGGGGSDPIGGGSGGSGGSGGGGALQEQGTARIEVNTETGAVKVTPLGEPAPGSNQSKSLYTGSAISVTSSSLSTDSSELTVKKLTLKVKNNTADYILNPRLVIDKLSSGGAINLGEFTNVATVVGPGTTTGDGPGPSVTITNPNGIARDEDGSVYISGFGDGTMRRLKDGFVSRITSGLTAPGGVDVLPGTGFVFTVEQSGHRLVRVPAAGGSKYILAGSGAAGLADGSGAAAQFSSPRDMVILDSTAYIADFGNSRIRKVTNLSGANGVVTTLNVSPAIVNPAGIGTFNAAGVDWLAVVSTTTHKLFIVNSANGQSFQIAGTGVPGFTEGAGNLARFSSPSDVAAVGANLYVCELNNKRIRQVTLMEGADPKNPANWVVGTVAGTGGTGTLDGQGTIAQFTTARHIVADGSGALLVTDINVNRVRKVTTTSGVFPITGTGSGTGSVQPIGVDGYIPSDLVDRRPFYRIDGALEPRTEDINEAQREMTFTVAPDVKSFHFVVTLIGSPNSTAAALDAVTNTGSPLRGSGNVNIRTIAGQLVFGFADGPATVALFGYETYVAVSDIGFFVSDYANRAIRYVDHEGNVTTVAGSKSTGVFTPGNGTACSFGNPVGIWSNPAGTELYVGDYANNVVARLSRNSFAAVDDASSWTMALVAGAPGTSANAVGTGSSTRFSDPFSIAATPDGRTVYVADRANNAIKQLAFLGGDRNVADNWQSSFYAGSTTALSGSTDGQGTSALFYSPAGLALSTSGDLFVSEYFGGRIRRISPASRNVTFLAGSTSDVIGYVDGPGVTARFTLNFSITTDNAGYVYVADQALVRRVDVATGAVATVAGNSALSDNVDGPGNTGLVYAKGISYSPKLGLILSGGSSIRVVERIVRNGAP